MQQSNLSILNLENNVVSRKCIEEKLMQLPERRIALVTGPSGYGKTTGVASFLTNQPTRYAWCTLNESVKNPDIFWRYFTASVAVSTKNNKFSSIAINEELLASNISTNIFIDMLKELEENIILVLDDCHFLKNETVIKNLMHFVKNLPQNVSIIFISQMEVDDSLFVNFCNPVIRIGTKDLAFNNKEIREFFLTRNIYLNDDEINDLQRATDGWVTGLIFASFQHGRNYSDLHEEYFDNYFQNAVMDKLSEETKAFLVHVSFLDELKEPLCKRVTGNKKSGEILKNLIKNNIYIVADNETKKEYRFNVLFKRFLFNKLKKEDAKLQRSLFLRAAEWFRENNNYVKAIEHYIKAGEVETALEIYKNDYEKIKFYDPSDFKALVMSFPEGVRENDVLLCVDYSWLLALIGDYEDSKYWAEKAQANYDLRRDEYSDSEREFLRTKIMINYINMYLINADLNSAIRYYKKVLLNPGINLMKSEANIGEISMLNTAYGFRGELQKIDETYAEHFETIPEVLGDMSAYIAVLLAECQFERNDLHAVYTTLSSFMGKITHLSFPGLIVPCMTLLAKEKLSKGKVSEALDMVESGRKMLYSKSEKWQRLFDAFIAYICVYAGEAAKAEAYLKTEEKSVFDKLDSNNEYEYIVFARYLMAVDNLDEALLLLSRLEEFAIKENRKKSLIEVMTLKAINHYLRGKPSEAMSVLDQALELGMNDGYVRVFIGEGQIMAEMLNKYRTWEKYKGEQRHQKYVRTLISQMTDCISMLSDAEEAAEDDRASVTTSLSAREIEVLQLLASEYSNAEIADKLFITERTVKHHNASIYEKLGVKNRLEAIIKAKTLMLIE